MIYGCAHDLTTVMHLAYDGRVIQYPLSDAAFCRRCPEAEGKQHCKIGMADVVVELVGDQLDLCNCCHFRPPTFFVNDSQSGLLSVEYAYRYLVHN